MTLRVVALGLSAVLAVLAPLHASERYDEHLFSDVFVRGDANADGTRNLTDAIFILLYLFEGGPAPTCLRAADLDDDGQVQINDGIYTLNHLFAGGPGPAAPQSECGTDTTADDLTCHFHAPCEFEALVHSYDLLVTLAGTGHTRERGTNSWRAEFEGGPATAAELSRPHHAIADDAGNIYVADKDAHAIRKIAPDGTITTVAGTNNSGDGDDDPGPATERALSAPNGIWVRGDGTFYILDLGNSKVRRVSPAGEMRTLFRSDVPISVGRGLWVADDESEAFFSSFSEVKRWTPDDGVTTYVGGFANLGNLAVDPAGSLVVTDRGQHRVFRIGPDLEKIPIAGNGSSFGGGDGEPALSTAVLGVRGIWFLSTGGYFLATHEGSQVWYVDTRGFIHLFLDGLSDHSHRGDGENFRTPGRKISEARAVSVTPRGDVIVTENDFGYIRAVLLRE